MRKILLIRMALAALLAFGAWGVFAQIQKASVAMPVTQAPMDTTELPLRVRTVEAESPYILSVRQSVTPLLPAADDTKEAAQWTRVCGSVLYADNWGTGNTPYGVYSIPLNGGEFTPLHVANDLNANGGGFFKDNYYYCTNYGVSNGIGYYHNVKYSTSTWTRSTYGLSSVRTTASDFAPDPVTGKVYSCSRNTKADEWYLTTMDVSKAQWDPSYIALLDVCLSGMAVDNEGQIYGVGTDGMFYHIHKTTGKMTKIGDTGLRPGFLSSACTDPTTGEFYYSTVLTNNQGGLYTIDYTTGKATLVCNYPHNQQVVGIYIPKAEAKDAAPDAAQNLKVSYEPGALTGTISFDAPATQYDGKPGTGKIKCLVKAGSTTLKQDSVEYGSKGYSLTWKITKPANTTFSVVFSNKAGGNGPTRKETHWIGNDVPNDVTEVTLHRAGNKFGLNWNASKGGTHGGYCPADNISYTIVRYPENKTVATGYKGTAFEETLENPESITGFYYTVQAVNGTQKSKAVQSNTVIIGDVTPPYHEGFNTSAPFYTYKVIDANGDGKTFKWRQYGPAKNGMAACDYNSARKIGKDDWLISPAINMKGGKAYIIEFDVGTGSDFGENLRVGFSNEPTVEAMNQNILLDTTYFQSCIFTRARVVATPKTDGKYYFGLHACTPTLQYYMDFDNVDIYAALDPSTPDVPANLLPVVKKDGTGVDVSFTAPKTTVTGKALGSIAKIEVIRDGNVLHTYTAPAPGAELKYSDALAHATGRFKYEVRAYSATEAGPAADYTLRMEEGPFIDNFTEYGSLSCFTRVDINNDHTQWDFYPLSSTNSTLRIYNNKQHSNDDWLISYPVWLKGGYYYDIRFKLGGSNNAPQEISAYYGFAPTPEGMTMELLQKSAFTASKTSQYILNGSLMVQEDGFYYFGFHATSPMYDGSMCWMTFDDFEIGQGLSFAAPGKAQSLTITPDFEGANEGIVSIKAPVLSINNDTITDLTKIDLYRDNALIKTFTEVEPGGNYIFKDVDMKTGVRTYKVICHNSAGEGLPLETQQYMGINRPGVPNNVVAAETSNPGEVMVSWDAPKTDNAGNPQNLNGVTYEIRSYHDRAFLDHTMESETTSIKSLDWQQGDPQTLVYYYALAKNQLGLSQGAGISNILPLGPAYEGMYHENVFNGIPTYTYGQRQHQGGQWVVASNSQFPDVTPVDGNGMFIMRGQYKNSSSDLMTGRIKLGADPVLEFFYYSISPKSANYFSVKVDDGSGEGFKEVANVVNNEGEMKWNKVSVPLSQYAGKTVQLQFTGVIQNYVYMFLDDIRVYNACDKNVAIMQATGPKRGMAGSNVTMRFSVENMGKQNADKYNVHLLRNGNVVKTQEVTKALAPGESHEMKLTDKLGAGMGDTIVYTVRVEMEGDMNVDDNTSLPVEVMVSEAGLPQPLTLTGETADNKNVSLKWQAPNPQLLNTESVTDNFEKMSAWETEYFGRWQTADVDGELQGGISNVYLEGIQQVAGSYFVFDVSDPRFAEAKDTYAAYSGSKSMASMYNLYGGANDDWLFSPRLNGKAQTITFYARSASQSSPESFEFYYSKTDRYPDNFIKVGAKSYISSKWTKNTFSVPEGAKYFAIRHVSKNMFILMLDDFTFIPAAYEITDANLTGYIVYRDGMPLNETPFAGTSYTDLDVPAGNHIYSVTAMYDRGESSPSNLISVTTNAVNGLYDNGANVRARAGHIIITGASDMNVSVTRHDGITIFSNAGSDFIDVAADKGVYIVRLGSRTVKVLVQ